MVLSWDGKEGTHDLREGFPVAPEPWADSINATDTLDGYTTEEAVGALAEWYRALKPGGMLTLAVLDVAALVEQAKTDTQVDLPATLYGRGVRKSVWNTRGVVMLLRRAGFVNVTATPGPVVVLAAYKPTESLATGSLAGVVAGVMSCPRLGFTANRDTCIGIAIETGVGFESNENPYWGKGLTQGFERAIKAGYKWVVAMDYDTVADGHHVRELVRIAESRGVDALAACQMRRESAEALAAADPAAWDAIANGEECVPVKSAHFGLTLLRCEAFAKMPRPWFKPKHDADGSWGEGATDEDVVFWQQWVGCGNTLAMSGSVCIGHIEAVISIMGNNGGKVYVPLSKRAELAQRGRY